VKNRTFKDIHDNKYNKYTLLINVNINPW
jgi:hypothetical protein